MYRVCTNNGGDATNTVRDSAPSSLTLPTALVLPVSNINSVDLISFVDTNYVVSALLLIPTLLTKLALSNRVDTKKGRYGVPTDVLVLTTY